MRRWAHVVNAALLILLFGSSLWVYPFLPARIPRHFGIGGVAGLDRGVDPKAAPRPASDAVIVLCLVDRPSYALEHLLIDPPLSLQVSKHSICLGCAEYLFSCGSKKLTGDP